MRGDFVYTIDRKPALKNHASPTGRGLAPVRDTVFVSLDAANAAIRERLATLNAAPLSGDKTTCRTRILAEQERAHLRPLPADPFVPGAWSRYKLAPDYNVVIDGPAHSVPFT